MWLFDKVKLEYGPKFHQKRAYASAVKSSGEAALEKWKKARGDIHASYYIRDGAADQGEYERIVKTWPKLIQDSDRSVESDSGWALMGGSRGRAELRFWVWERGKGTLFGVGSIKVPILVRSRYTWLRWCERPLQRLLSA